ncbi:hypothetical protein TCAL_12877, partial [Tigriopus californicus]|eukprot:TCALIF_12877-PA protein Name:"Similar to knrl Knirps-related protein (Drosophila melanogaster)" AED:0.35 eAED:0.35 QI:58/0.5/0.33/0.66/0.5/0.33/3/0/197
MSLNDANHNGGGHRSRRNSHNNIPGPSCSSSASSPRSAHKQDKSDPLQNQLCRVCHEPAAGYHFGAFTCEGCKSFFGRTCNNQSIVQDCKNSFKCVDKSQQQRQLVTLPRDPVTAGAGLALTSPLLLGSILAQYHRTWPFLNWPPLKLEGLDIPGLPLSPFSGDPGPEEGPMDLTKPARSVVSKDANENVIHESEEK